MIAGDAEKGEDDCSEYFPYKGISAVVPVIHAALPIYFL
jgi:hypothetical protein